MRFTPRTCTLLVCASAVPLIAAPLVMLVVMAIIAALAVIDATAVRHPPTARRSLGGLSRGVASMLVIDVDAPRASRIEIRQPLAPDMISPRAVTRGAQLHTTLTPTRRGAYELAPIGVRCDGPWGLGRWYHVLGDTVALKVYADLPAAQRLASAVRQRSIRAVGSRQRGPLGVGTDFESVREYRPDDDVRQLNWRATSRIGRPMSNSLRVEQDSDVWILVDFGRLCGAALQTASGPASRLDVFLDAGAALGLVADGLQDRVGFIAYAGSVLHQFPPRRRGGAAAIELGFGIEPIEAESDHGSAFVACNTTRRASVFIFTDVVDAASVDGMVRELPSLCRRHDVIVCLVDDPAYPTARMSVSPGTSRVMTDIDAATTDAIRLIHSTGAQVLLADSERFSESVVQTYVNRRSGSASVPFQIQR